MCHKTKLSQTKLKLKSCNKEMYFTSDFQILCFFAEQLCLKELIKIPADHCKKQLSKIIPENEFQDHFQQWYHHLIKCIALQGEYFEGDSSQYLHLSLSLFLSLSIYMYIYVPLYIYI